jgi:hypothetical protein
MAWFIFIGPGVAEFTHAIFPLLQPAIRPELAQTLSQAVSNGKTVAEMRNYWVHTTGSYYFPGLYTAVLPMTPASTGSCGRSGPVAHCDRTPIATRSGQGTGEAC